MTNINETHDHDHSVDLSKMRSDRLNSILESTTTYHGSDCDSDNSFKSDSSFEYSDDDEDE